MKKLSIFILISICLVLSLLIVGCDKPASEIPSDGDNDFTWSDVEIHLKVIEYDSGKWIYNDYTDKEDIPTLSLGTDYLMEATVWPGNFVIEDMCSDYDEQVVELTEIETERYSNQQYLLRGLKECTDSMIEIYSPDWAYDSEGNLISDSRYSCTITVSFA